MLGDGCRRRRGLLEIELEVSSDLVAYLQLRLLLKEQSCHGLANQVSTGRARRLEMGSALLATK